jgi:two-component sensor histidine kinase
VHTSGRFQDSMITGGPRRHNSTYDLIVSDNGIGLPEAIDIHTAQSLGLRLVAILVEDQLKGEIDLEREGGTRVRIRFKTQQ